MTNSSRLFWIPLLVGACFASSDLSGKAPVRWTFERRAPEDHSRPVNVERDLAQYAPELRSTEWEGIDIHLRYPTACSSTAEGLLEEIERVVSLTAGRLNGRLGRLEGVTVVVLEASTLPNNFRYRHRSRKRETGALLLAQSCDDPDWMRSAPVMFGLLSTLPHEMTHSTLERGESDESCDGWIEEGWTQKVSMDVATQVSPEFAAFDLARHAPLVSFLTATEDDLDGLLHSDPTEAGSDPASSEAMFRNYRMAEGVFLAAEFADPASLAREVPCYGVEEERVRNLWAARSSMLQALVARERTIAERTTSDSPARRALALTRLARAGVCVPVEGLADWPCVARRGAEEYGALCDGDATEVGELARRCPESALRFEVTP